MFKLDFDTFANKALSKIGDVLVDQAQDNMQKVSMGKAYIIGGKVHIASKRGDTANNMSGALSKTIRFEIQGKILEFGAGNKKINYAKFIENPNGLNRPNYTKSILQSKDEIDKIVQVELMNAMRWKQ
jgi:hypothetical protein